MQRDSTIPDLSIAKKRNTPRAAPQSQVHTKINLHKARHVDQAEADHLTIPLQATQHDLSIEQQCFQCSIMLRPIREFAESIIYLSNSLSTNSSTHKLTTHLVYRIIHR